ncbi:MAG: hypothetical protein V4563_16835 [Pseudomonadota bacterium]
MKLKLEMSVSDFQVLLSELRFIKTNIAPAAAVLPVVNTEADYHSMLSQNWGTLPADMTLDADGVPQVKAPAVPPDFRGVVAGD